MSSEINNVDVVNFGAVKRKLKLSMVKLLAMQKAKKKNPQLTDSDLARTMLGLKPDADIKAYLETKLTASEIETLGKFLKLDE